MKTIIVATDFSAAASNAAHYAADMAININANVVLLHIYQLSPAYLEVPVAINIQEFISSVQTNIDELVDDLNAKVNRKMKIETLIAEGFFLNELKKVCNKIQPFAVIMGCQGTTASERLFFGNHAINAMQQLQWPLITVPANNNYTKIKHIALACDFDKVVDTIPVQKIKNLIHDFDAQLHVININKTTEHKPEIIFQSGLLQEELETLNPRYHFITHENIEEGIINFTQKNNIDLLLMIPKHHNFMDKLLHSSHTKQFVLHSHTPVMALHI